MSVNIERECVSCGSKVGQSVVFTEDEGKIIIEVWRPNCPNCEALLKKPTIGEIRRVLAVLNE